MTPCPAIDSSNPPADPPRAGATATTRSFGAFVLTALLALTSASTTNAQETELAALFPLQAPIKAPADRFVRLDLPAEVLAACRSDLADLRVFDHQGMEVPYAIDRGDAATEGLEIVSTIVPKLVAVDQRTEGSDETPRRWIEIYHLKVPAALARSTDETGAGTDTAAGVRSGPQAGNWHLLIASGVDRFVRQAKLTVSGGSDEGPVLLAAGSLFRLTDPDRESLLLDLSAITPGTAETWELTLEGREGPYLEPEISFVQVTTVPGRDRVAVPLTEIGREQRDGVTVVVLERPAGLTPDLLRTHASSASFNRAVEVWDEGPNRTEEPLARGRISRAPAVETTETLDLPMRVAHGDRLRVVIRDLDAPALADLSFQAVIRAPALLFVLPGHSQSLAPDTSTPDPTAVGARTPRTLAKGNLTTGMLRFGGARAHRPRYDLASLDARTGPDAVHTGRYDPALLLPATLGTVARSADFDPTPALAFAQGPGARVVRRNYRHQRRIDVQPSGDGLSKLVLRAEDLALMRADRADLRIVDQAGQQRAFLLVDGSFEWRELTVSVPTAIDRGSLYRLTPPVLPARIDQLSLAPTVPFFDRAFALEGQTPRGAITPLRGRMHRRLGDPRPWRIDFPDTRVSHLDLRIEDGDDAPLQFRRIAGRFPIVEVYFPAEAGQYQLLLGDPDARPARFELAGIRQVVLALESRAARLGPLQANPDFRALSRVARGNRWQAVALWAVIALAVLFLATISLRLARQEGPS